MNIKYIIYTIKQKHKNTQLYRLISEVAVSRLFELCPGIFLTTEENET
jgi:hypothetical protein